jgi:hypothetical protein
LQSTEGIVLMINAIHHFVTSVTGGRADNEYSFDNGGVRNIGKRQMRGRLEVRSERIDDLILLKRR